MKPIKIFCANYPLSVYGEGRGEENSVGGEIYFDTKWWNQYPLSFGFRYSYLLDNELAGPTQKGVFEFVLRDTEVKPIPTNYSGPTPRTLCTEDATKAPSQREGEKDADFFRNHSIADVPELKPSLLLELCPFSFGEGVRG
jgi:hypothetical protein